MAGMNDKDNIHTTDAASSDDAGTCGKSVASVVGDMSEKTTATATDEQYMRMALDEARKAADMGEVPIGAVVVYQPIDRGTRRPTAEPRVIARAFNRRETYKDPAGHAEFLAMKTAAEALDAWRLTDCTVYVTLEPCIMCAGLMHQARISRCVYGAPDQKAGAVGTLYSVHSDQRLNHNFDVTAGVLRDECVALLQEFFASRRKSAGRQTIESNRPDAGSCTKKES